MQVDFVFIIIILILSVVIHEVSHGYVAQMLGDPTARLAGRLTLNPLKHLDPLGSVIIPALLVLTGAGFIIGWAKPVPYNPYNLRNQRWGEALVAGAGPLVNISIAVIFGILIRLGVAFDFLSTPFVELASIVVFLNILLAFFNLLPVPPLDGSKILFALLPYKLQFIQEFLERYWFITIFVIVIFLWRILFPIVLYLFQFVTGVPFF